MNFVYILGNGFDINIGLKTRYLDFYDYYLTKPTEDSLIESFKQHLKMEITDTDKWSDLELSLGEYLKHLSSVNEFDSLLDNIQDDLAEYLEKIQLEYRNALPDRPNNSAKVNLLHDIFMPERYLGTRDKDKLVEFYKTISSNANYFNIVNFNYTNTVESILGINKDSNEHLSLGLKLDIRGKEHVLQSICHVHGSVYENMVLGVNDKSQIINDNFKENIDITSQFVKSECNLAQRHAVERTCERVINGSDVICIFGSSLGETDKIWWELIAKEVKERDCRLVIFEFNNSIRKLNPARGNRRRRELVERIFGETVPETIGDKIFISFNSDIFKTSRLST